MKQSAPLEPESSLELEASEYYSRDARLRHPLLTLFWVMSSRSSRHWSSRLWSFLQSPWPRFLLRWSWSRPRRWSPLSSSLLVQLGSPPLEFSSVLRLASAFLGADAASAS